MSGGRKQCHKSATQVKKISVKNDQIQGCVVSKACKSNILGSPNLTAKQGGCLVQYASFPAKQQAESSS